MGLTSHSDTPLIHLPVSPVRQNCAVRSVVAVFRMAEIIYTAAEYGHFVKDIKDHPHLMQTWKSQWPNILNVDKETSTFVAFRISIDRLDELSGGLPRQGPGVKLNFMNPETGRLFISPTTHTRSGINRIADCVKIAERTKQLDVVVRVCVVSSCDDGKVDGFDLGAYKVDQIDVKNFIYLAPCPEQNELSRDDIVAPTPPPTPSLMGRKILYNGRCYESAGEARFAVLLDFLEVPFSYEKNEHMVALTNGLIPQTLYKVDFILWPDDFKKMVYVEWKLYPPTLEEQEKMETLVGDKAVPGFIAWGQEWTQSIKWTSRVENDDRTETRGVRLMKFTPVIQGGNLVKVRRTEGFYLAANDKALGRSWIETEPCETEVGCSTFDTRRLRTHLKSPSIRLARKIGARWVFKDACGRVPAYGRRMARGFAPQTRVL